MYALFKLQEPMLFRGSMEFSPNVRGPKTIVTSLILPTPSTIAGALATFYLDTQKLNLPQATGWERDVVEILGLDEAQLKGPYLIVEQDSEEELYIQFEDKDEQHLVKFSEIVRALQSLDQDLRKSLVVKKKKLWELLKDNHVEFYQPAFTERVGTRLERLYKRVKEGGGLYTIRMVDYSVLRSNKESKKSNLSVAVDICGRSKLFELEKREGVLRLGGEGKISQLVIKEGEPLTSKVNKLLTSFEKGEAYLYLLTYSLYRSSKDYLKIQEVCKGGYVAPTVWRRLEEFLREFSPSIKVKYIIGACKILGAGYSLSSETRKPIYATLPPGTIIKVEGTKEDLHKLYREGISEVGSKIGYGTVIPIPLIC